MSHTDTEAPISELDYNAVADAIIFQVEHQARHMSRGDTLAIEYPYENAIFHNPAVAMYLAVKTQPRDFRHDSTLFGVHRFTLL